MTRNNKLDSHFLLFKIRPQGAKQQDTRLPPSQQMKEATSRKNVVITAGQQSLTIHT